LDAANEFAEFSGCQSLAISGLFWKGVEISVEIKLLESHILCNREEITKGSISAL